MFFAPDSQDLWCINDVILNMANPSCFINKASSARRKDFRHQTANAGQKLLRTIKLYTELSRVHHNRDPPACLVTRIFSRTNLPGLLTVNVRINPMLKAASIGWISKGSEKHWRWQN